MADAIRIRKKDIQDAKRPDAVLERATSLYDWLVERRKPLLTLLGLVGLALIITSYVSSSSAERSREVGGELSKAVVVAARPVFEGSSSDDAFPSAQARAEAVQEAYEGVTKTGAGTRAARTAQFGLAFAHLEQGRFDEAIAGFEAYLKGNNSQDLRAFAWEGLGQAQEAKGDLDAARSAFAKLEAVGAPGLALFHQARLAEQAGERDRARELYEQIVAEYELESVATDAKVRLELLGLAAR